MTPPPPPAPASTPIPAATTPGRRYALIAPARDEARYCRRTLDAIAAQTVPPALLIVVDDGSTDAMPQILEEYRSRLPYLRIIRRADRGVRSVGPGVIDAFVAGYDTLNPNDFDYICKIDLDLDFKPAYFETVIRHMEADPRLGSFSGKPFYREFGNDADRLIPETCGDENSVGMIKFFRVACFKQIGGFVRQVMWDGIDCHTARLLGWKTGSSASEDALRFIHLRPMGSSHLSLWTGRKRHGAGQYFMGTSPIYMLASAAFRLRDKPPVVGSVAMLWGYFRAMLARTPRYDRPGFRAFLRDYQRDSLFRGKHAATERVHARQANTWNPR